MAKITFILGGARSGKSGYGVELAKKIGKKVVFIATCVHPDREMKHRIKRHKASRPPHWDLVEEGEDIASVLADIEKNYKIILIDCLGLWISNLMAKDLKDKEIESRIVKLTETVSRAGFAAIVISNEVGCGVVPDTSSGRRFRDLIGFANQVMAKSAAEVIVMQAGIPIKIKNRGR